MQKIQKWMEIKMLDIGNNTPKTLTRKNPDRKTYRIPMRDDMEIRIESDRYGCTLYGDVANALGWWESWGMTPQEAEKIFLAAGKKRTN